MAGRLLEERAIANGGDCPLGNNLMRVAELEFAFRFGADLPPRATPYIESEVLDAVEALLPAIEIPDSRYSHFETAGAPQLIADNACAHRYLFGADVTVDWRGIDLAAHTVRAYRNGAHIADGIGSNVLGDPRTALTWLVNELSSHGLTLKAGQTVITGTCVVPIPIAVGETIAGDFGVLGRVEIRIV
jgi:2-keto-4-pentenoate hydratase